MFIEDTGCVWCGPNSVLQRGPDATHGKVGSAGRRAVRGQCVAGGAVVKRRRREWRHGSAGAVISRTGMRRAEAHWRTVRK